MTVLFVIAPRDFRDEELLEPLRALKAAGHAVSVASLQPGTCTGLGGARVDATLGLSEARPEDFDGVVFVGGPGARALFDHPDAHRLARELFAAGKLVGAICIAPVILARAGLLRGKRATVFETEATVLRDEGASVLSLGVVADGTLVTARGPREAKDFGKALVKALSQVGTPAKEPSVVATRSSQPRT
jgi:protease I